MFSIYSAAKLSNVYNSPRNKCMAIFVFYSKSIDIAISYLFRHGKKSIPFAHKWRINELGIVINNPKIMYLLSYKFYVGSHIGRFGIVNYNPRHTYYSLVPKQYTFSATEGSP